MGSLITLSVGRMEVDWGKNDLFVNHSKLFLPLDNQRTVNLSDDEEEENDSVYSRPLSSVVRRLELLGYNLEHCRQLYEELAGARSDEYDEVDVSFDRFAKALASVRVGKVRLPHLYEGYDLGMHTLADILKDFEFSKLFEDIEPYVVDPYVVLRLLAENQHNLGEAVVWHYHDVVEGGWVEEEELYEGLEDADRHLIVTEGKSDSTILKKSLGLLYDDIDDFFSFIDMTENYPFTGTGNLTNFCQGLARIRIQNKVLVVFDNDTAGNAAYQKVKALILPPNMRLALLPPLPEFESFPTLGPSGPNTEDINGKAVAIELYLDLSRGQVTTPTVRWTSYDKKLGRYQGELVDKEAFANDFIKRHSLGPDYDVTKLRRLWAHLVEQCTSATKS
ncbi:HEPN/Toprim-associated domain-containing protein [Tundrisphaera lichenicola]|uniref:HEPN/Toprim-associated domain-containing protein n=1 Tax=Tundrisphaera lichenicola TaxID=2029860 RepID=UPI003EC0B691